MKTRQVTLIPDVSNVHIHKSSEKQTEIAFNSALWPGKTCTHIVSGKWEIDKVEDNLVTLVNHDEVIKLGE